jgi:hypothetical protein
MQLKCVVTYTSRQKKCSKNIDCMLMLKFTSVFLHIGVRKAIQLPITRSISDDKIT